MWSEQPLEKQLRLSLRKCKDFDQTIAEQYYDHYKQARNYLVAQVFPYIQAREPDLTDHSATHIQDVMKNVHLLLKDEYKKLPAMDLYVLTLCVLFHDSGNIFGRGQHASYDVIAQVYDNVFPSDPNVLSEKRAILKAASAHSGRATDGSGDTLKDIPETIDVYGFSVRLREMAALLRFADELAEGSHRTSQFLQKYDFYSPTSRIYHKYANSVSIHIDRPLQRIALTYHFRLDVSGGRLTKQDEKEFKELLLFTYGRIEKLNQERNYARHYSVYCADFKRTSVAINIEKNGQRLSGLEDCVLEDRVIPGESKHTPFPNQFTTFAPGNIIKILNQPTR